MLGSATVPASFGSNRAFTCHSQLEAWHQRQSHSRLPRHGCTKLQFFINSAILSLTKAALILTLALALTLRRLALLLLLLASAATSGLLLAGSVSSARLHSRILGGLIG